MPCLSGFELYSRWVPLTSGSWPQISPAAAIDTQDLSFIDQTSTTATRLKSNIFRLAKQQLCTCITLFWHISLALPSLQVTATWLRHEFMPNFTFYGGRKHVRDEMSFACWTWIWFLGTLGSSPTFEIAVHSVTIWYFPASRAGVYFPFIIDDKKYS